MVRRFLGFMGLLAFSMVPACLGGASSSESAGSGGSGGGSGGSGATGGASGGLPAVGDTCTEEGTLVCGSDATGTQDNIILYCENGSYVQEAACPGLQDCSNVQGHSSVRCGTETIYVPYAKSGAPCAASDAAACTFDETIVLLCDKGYWVDAIHCPPSNCMLHNDTEGKYVACANNGYSVGDICTNWENGAVACSTDLTKILSCSNGTTVVHTDCGSGTCTLVDTNTIACQ